MPTKAPMAPIAAPIYNWTGLYIGGVVGYGWTKAIHCDASPAPSVCIPVTDMKGWNGGVTLGYNWQWANWVLGVEGDWSWANMTGHSPDPPGFGCGTSCDNKIKSFETARVRVGYADRDLDINESLNTLSWMLPEIPPRITTVTTVSAKTIQDQFQKYADLPEEMRTRLLRSMQRFSLSQCRIELIDRVLDLALAFEIAVSGPAKGNAPVSWKVSVRCAQAIGGPLETRQRTRDVVNELFKLRNRATHGGSMSPADTAEIEKTVISCCLRIYQTLVASLLTIGVKLDWSVLELQART